PVGRRSVHFSGLPGVHPAAEPSAWSPMRGRLDRVLNAVLPNGLGLSPCHPTTHALLACGVVKIYQSVQWLMPLSMQPIAQGFRWLGAACPSPSLCLQSIEIKIEFYRRFEKSGVENLPAGQGHRYYRPGAHGVVT